MFYNSVFCLVQWNGYFKNILKIKQKWSLKSGSPWSWGIHYMDIRIFRKGGLKPGVVSHQGGLSWTLGKFPEKEV